MFSQPSSPRDSRYTQRIPYINHTPLPTPHDPRSQWPNEPPSPRMSPDLLPPPPSHQHSHSRAFRRWRAILRSTPLRSGIFFGAVVFISLFFYTTVLSPRGSWLRPPNWHGLSQNESLVQDLDTSPSVSLSTPIPVETSHPLPSPPPISNVLTVEQIRDIVAPTRGFFTRDYSLGLGWNNMRYILDAAVLQADLLNRTLVIPSFVYARACHYNLTVCADYATMVNKGDAIGWEEWRELPYEQQMGFRIPISVMIDLPRLRQRSHVITASEYLRLHGQDPASESSSGFWLRDWYIANPNVFESNKTKTPSQFIIENHWYDPTGTNRVDHIPQAMKSRGKWERYPEPEIRETAGFWPPEEPTNISNLLTSALPEGRAFLDWGAAKGVLRESRLGQEEDLNDDDVEGMLNANGWEVLHTFDSVLGMEYAKTVVHPIRQVAQRSTIRGFRDDYYHVDADVVVLAGETHLGRKPGAMRFTEEPARARFASMVVHFFVFPPKVLALADTLATRIREMNGGRLWMGAHMRRGDFVRFGWAMESTPEAHVKRVKERLQNGRSVLEHLGDLSTYDFAGAKPDLEQVTLLPPLPDDRFYIATDERDPEGLKVIRDAGAILLSDLLTMEDRREFGWPLMITDVRAIVEQAVLVHSAFFYGHAMSSLAGVVTNMRAARGADPRTMVLD